MKASKQQDPTTKLSFNSPKNKDNSNQMFFSPVKTKDRPQSSYLTTEVSLSPRRSFRKSVIFPKHFFNSIEEPWQLTLSLKREMELSKKVQEKKYYLELKQLVKERSKFRAALIQTRDPKSLELLSNKILKVNLRISNIMKKISGEMLPQSVSKDSPMDQDNETQMNFDQMDFSAMKDDLKKVDNYLKVSDLIFEGKIMDMKQNLQVKKKASYFFQRQKVTKLYEPCTDLGRNTKSRNRNTLFLKGYRPFGFRTARDQKSPPYIPTTFEDILYQCDERKKDKDQDNGIGKDKEKNKEEEKHNNDIRTFETEATFRSKTEGNESKKQSTKYNNNNNKHHRIATACLVIKNTNNLLTNTKIINDSIKATMKEDQKTVRSNHYKKLLLLLAKRLEKPKQDKKKRMTGKEFDQERIYTERLQTMPQSAKPLFRKVFKRILAEDNHLNKPNPLHTDVYDQKIQYLKRQKEFQKEAYKNMYLLKEQADKINDDEEVFKDVKIFDNYGNIDSLEWLVKKKNALKPDHRIVGAYNPHEKGSLNINYKDI